MLHFYQHAPEVEHVGHEENYASSDEPHQFIFSCQIV